MLMKSILLLLPLLLGLLLFPAEAADGAAQALRLCATSVIPALFPYMVLCRLLSARSRLPAGLTQRLSGPMQRLFGVGGNVLSPLLLSYLGGYPIGVVSVCAQYRAGLLQRGEVERALRFCNNSGPAFFLGILGGQIFRDRRAGLLLYCIHILSGLLVGMATALPADDSNAIPPVSAQQRPGFGSALLSAIEESCAALLQICGLVLSFRVLLRLGAAVGLLSALPSAAQAVLIGSLELTSGLLSLAPTRSAFVLAAFLMGWGGLCVQMQASSIYRPLGLHPRGCLLCKLLHGLLSAGIALLCCLRSPLALSALALLPALAVALRRLRIAVPEAA